MVAKLVSVEKRLTMNNQQKRIVVPNGLNNWNYDNPYPGVLLIGHAVECVCSCAFVPPNRGLLAPGSEARTLIAYITNYQAFYGSTSMLLLVNRIMRNPCKTYKLETQFDPLAIDAALACFAGFEFSAQESTLTGDAIINTLKSLFPWKNS